MKKLIFFGAISAAVLFTATFVACNSTEEPMIEDISSTTTLQSADFDIFMASVDSLNNAYFSVSRAAVSEDGSNPTLIKDERWSKQDIVNYADQAGSLIGGTLGTAAGYIAGASTSGLASGVLGFLGGHLGDIVYSHLYSAVAKLVTRCEIVNPGFNSSITHHENSSEYTYLDSIGVRHNRLMQRMAQYDKKYRSITPNNRILLNKFYDDFIKELNATYPEVGGFIISSEEKERILESCSSVLSIGEKYLNKKGGKKLFIEEVSDLMVKKYKVPAKNVKIFKEFAVSVTNQMDKIDESNIDRYANDLDQVIQESNIDGDEKAAIINMGQIAVNSNICWKK
ncbi:MAG: hypothetical protein DBY35_00595 [Bacteroidales bacterium]|nr:MAG: hypothetical protein DBY35_00595 [Bacteroidales bacterium]